MTRGRIAWQGGGDAGAVVMKEDVRDWGHSQLIPTFEEVINDV